MSRHRPGKAHGHGIARLGGDTYRIFWTWDRYYKGSRLRFPQLLQRVTDRNGAERFSKKWGCPMPADTPRTPIPGPRG